jgi:hypothetical protein
MSPFNGKSEATSESRKKIPLIMAGVVRNNWPENQLDFEIILIPT